jgi:hypothetical protein
MLSKTNVFIWGGGGGGGESLFFLTYYEENKNWVGAAASIAYTLHRPMAVSLVIPRASRDAASESDG